MAQSKYEQAAHQESALQQVFREWTRQRIANIHDRITIYDVLRQRGVSVEREDRPEQFSCPFHGKDNRPSARAYPGTPGSPSHAWCYVCQERWDAIGIWRKYAGADKKFTRILSEIERSFGLDPPPFPEGAESFEALREQEFASQEENKLDEFQRKLSVCDRRLIESKSAWRYASDLKGYLGCASLLERVSNRVQDRRMSVAEGEARIQAILDKIRERERECPAG